MCIYVYTHIYIYMYIYLSIYLSLSKQLATDRSCSPSSRMASGFLVISDCNISFFKYYFCGSLFSFCCFILLLIILRACN